ncbi:GrdX family protein [Acetomicrobium sp.]|uniref:GrdX family protein n=1 Tax=Acetomicrobium sp. TaxID=1872099 RepID=UPI002B25B936|nr:GrdX family protein [Acetomicrobium sp.]
MIIISNNNRVISSSYKNVIPVEGSPMEVLYEARKYVHIGYGLYGHPLAGNDRLWVNPYRTVVLIGPYKTICCRSVVAIEKSIERLSLSVSYFDMDPSRLDDYGLIDYELFISMIPEYESLIKK